MTDPVSDDVKEGLRSVREKKEMDDDPEIHSNKRIGLDWMDGWMDGWMEGWMQNYIFFVFQRKFV